MLASTSLWVEEGKEYTLLKKQAAFAGLGCVAAIGFSYFDYRALRRIAKPIYLVAIVLLTLCFVPGIGKEVNGESRWISLAGFTFQPAEPSKIALVIALSAWFAHYKSEVKTLKRGFVYPMVIMSVLVGLIFIEKDMGTSACLAAASIAMMFIAGVRVSWLMGAATLALSALYVIVRSNSNRWARIMAYLNPDDIEAQRGAFFQQWRALLAFGNGGVSGRGLGNGAEKHGYLPFAHTDFIFPMVGEELGLWFTLGTVFCLLMLAVFGVAIAARSMDFFGRLLAIGLTCTIVIPAMLNIGVTTAILPNTGLPLPFVSYGGTNLIFTWVTIGLLVSVHRHTEVRVRRGDRLLAKNRRTIRL